MGFYNFQTPGTSKTQIFKIFSVFLRHKEYKTTDTNKKVSEKSPTPPILDRQS